MKLDIGKVEEIKKLHSGLKSEDFYAIINCSGMVEFEDNNIANDLEVWDNTLAVNLSSNFYLAKIFYPIISKNGRFIMISSTDANYGGAITVAYAASKAGVNSLTKSLSLLFKDKMIRVNSIAPGWVKTPMIADNGEKFINEVAGINPLKRNADPIDISRVIKFLLSEQSDYINGQVITVDGGYTNQDPTLLLEEQTKV